MMHTLEHSRERVSPDEDNEQNHDQTEHHEATDGPDHPHQRVVRLLTRRRPVLRGDQRGVRTRGVGRLKHTQGGASYF